MFGLDNATLIVLISTVGTIATLVITKAVEIYIAKLRSTDELQTKKAEREFDYEKLLEGQIEKANVREGKLIEEIDRLRGLVDKYRDMYFSLKDKGDKI